MMRLCDHMIACPSGSCDVPPCDKCGALCPSSSWTRANEIDEEVRELNDLLARFAQQRARAKLHRDWRDARRRAS